MHAKSGRRKNPLIGEGVIVKMDKEACRVRGKGPPHQLIRNLSCDGMKSSGYCYSAINFLPIFSYPQSQPVYYPGNLV